LYLQRGRGFKESVEEDIVAAEIGFGVCEEKEFVAFIIDFL